MSQVKLNIGAARTRIPGFVNIDVDPRADITLDLNRDALPFEEDSVDLIFSYHTLEHIHHFLFALGEIYRVLRHGGRLLVGVPYVTCTEYNLVNPYHRNHFNEHSFDFFDPQKLKGSAAEENPIMFKKVFHHYHYMGHFRLLPEPVRMWCRRHLFNVVRKIDIGLLAIKSPHRSVRVSTDNRRRIRQEFCECCRARVAYKV